jgi:hypothetical protein
MQYQLRRNVAIFDKRCRFWCEVCQNIQGVFWNREQRGLRLEDAALIVVAKQVATPPLTLLDEVLRHGEYPARLGVRTAGDATVDELHSTAWDAVFLRWQKPEIHEVILIEKQILGMEEEATEILASLNRFTSTLPTSGGKLLIEEHLRETKVIYAFYTLPALLADADHPAWDAINALLCALADHTEGMIYALEEGFYDSEGEPMILDLNLTYDWEGDFQEEELEEEEA